MDLVQITAGETDPVRRRVRFFLVGVDGMTPAEGEAGGQPEISVNDGAFTAAGVGTLVQVEDNTYYAILDASVVASEGTHVETRYQSGATALCPGDDVQVIAAPSTPYDDSVLAANAAGPWEVETEAGRVRQHRLTEQIEAAKFLASQAAGTDPRRAVRFNRLNRRDPT